MPRAARRGAGTRRRCRRSRRAGRPPGTSRSCGRTARAWRCRRAVMRSARSHTPSCIAASAACTRSIDPARGRVAVGPGRDEHVDAGTGAPSSASSTCGSNAVLIRSLAVHARSAPGRRGTGPRRPRRPRSRARARPARRTPRRACCPRAASSAPSRAARVVGASGSPAAGSASPAERITSPAATRGSQRARCSAVPKRAIGSAAPTSVGNRRHRRHRAAALLDEHGELGEALPHAAVLGSAPRPRAGSRARARDQSSRVEVHARRARSRAGGRASPARRGSCARARAARAGSRRV